jgi:hypothetical protein
MMKKNERKTKKIVNKYILLITEGGKEYREWNKQTDNLALHYSMHTTANSVSQSHIYIQVGIKS